MGRARQGSRWYGYRHDTVPKEKHLMYMFCCIIAVTNYSKSCTLHLDGKGKTGDLTVSLDGMDVNMTQFPKKNTSRRSTDANGKKIIEKPFT